MSEYYYRKGDIINSTYRIIQMIGRVYLQQISHVGNVFSSILCPKNTGSKFSCN